MRSLARGALKTGLNQLKYFTEKSLKNSLTNIFTNVSATYLGFECRVEALNGASFILHHSVPLGNAGRAG